jgi:preprotein translocase subunit SecD
LIILTVAVTALALWINLVPRANPTDANDRRELWLGRDVHTRYGLDLRGGTQVLLRTNDPSITAEKLDIARQTIEQRVNGLGVAEATVQTSGSNRIIVELPDVGDPEQALQTIRSTGKLEFVDPGEERFSRASIRQVNHSSHSHLRVNPRGRSNSLPLRTWAS